MAELTEAQKRYVATLRNVLGTLEAAAGMLDGTEGLASGGERAMVIAHTGLELAIEVEEEEARSRD
jgi:hypothetical protein